MCVGYEQQQQQQCVRTGVPALVGPLANEIDLVPLDESCRLHPPSLYLSVKSFMGRRQEEGGEGEREKKREGEEMLVLLEDVVIRRVGTVRVVTS